jgi:hypothetical protein
MVVPYVPPIKDPEETKILELDDAMSSILENKKIQLEDKIRSYSQTLSKFLKMYKHNSTIPSFISTVQVPSEVVYKPKDEPRFLEEKSKDEPIQPKIEQKDEYKPQTEDETDEFLDAVTMKVPPIMASLFETQKPTFTVKTKRKNASIKSAANLVSESIALREKFRPTQKLAKDTLYKWEEINSLY